MTREQLSRYLGCWHTGKAGKAYAWRVAATICMN